MMAGGGTILLFIFANNDLIKKNAVWDGKRIYVKNCEQSEILPYLHANKLAFHRFIDTGRRYKIPGSEIKNFTKVILVAGVLVFSYAGSLSPNSHIVTQRSPGVTCTHSA